MPRVQAEAVPAPDTAQQLQKETGLVREGLRQIIGGLFSSKYVSYFLSFHDAICMLVLLMPVYGISCPVL